MTQVWESQCILPPHPPGDTSFLYPTWEREWGPRRWESLGSFWKLIPQYFRGWNNGKARIQWFIRCPHALSLCWLVLKTSLSKHSKPAVRGLCSLIYKVMVIFLQLKSFSFCSEIDWEKILITGGQRWWMAVCMKTWKYWEDFSNLQTSPNTLHDGNHLIRLSERQKHLFMTHTKQTSALQTIEGLPQIWSGESLQFYYWVHSTVEQKWNRPVIVEFDWWPHSLGQIRFPSLIHEHHDLVVIWWGPKVLILCKLFQKV